MLSALIQVLVIRLRDSLIKMGEELTQAAKSESQQRESSQYYQRRLEELKADMEELVQREAEASRRCMELVSAVPNAGCHLMEDFRCRSALLPFQWEPPPGLFLRAFGKQGETRKGWARKRCCYWLRTLGAGPKWTNGIHCCWIAAQHVCISNCRLSFPASHFPLQRQGSLLGRGRNQG